MRDEPADKLTVRPKPQPTIKGYAAWAFQRLMRRKRIPRAELAGWIIERWIDEDPDGYLAKRGISYEEFEKDESTGPARVMEFAKEKKQNGTEK